MNANCKVLPYPVSLAIKKFILLTESRISIPVHMIYNELLGGLEYIHWVAVESLIIDSMCEELVYISFMFNNASKLFLLVWNPPILFSFRNLNLSTIDAVMLKISVRHS